MLGLLFGRRASTEERATVRRRCATRDSAVKQCLAANDATACDAFGQDLDLCKVRLETRDRSFPIPSLLDALLPGRRLASSVAHLLPSRFSRAQGRVVCPDAAAEFSRCTHLVINHTGTKATTPDCGAALRKLRACLRTKRV
jgi:hypothetical protein